MKFLTKILLSSLGIFLFSGCATLTDYKDGLPKINVTQMTFDFKERTHPIIIVDYCINNSLDIDLPLKKAIFSLAINGTTIYNKTKDFSDEEISKNSKKCSKEILNPDVQKSTIASSLLLNTILDRKYTITSSLHYDDKESSKTISNYEGYINEDSPMISAELLKYNKFSKKKSKK
ncbi:MAG: hypothetical protein ACI4V7_08495 [Succinivibrionaceae bacterium]